MTHRVATCAATKTVRSIVICSVGFLAILLYAAFRPGEIPTRQFIIMRTLLALAGAGFTIGIPGFIYAEIGFDHGVGHPFLLLYKTKMDHGHNE